LDSAPKKRVNSTQQSPRERESRAALIIFMFIGSSAGCIAAPAVRKSDDEERAPSIHTAAKTKRKVAAAKIHTAATSGALLHSRALDYNFMIVIFINAGAAVGVGREMREASTQWL
jgi:hypothetical protein